MQKKIKIHNITDISSMVATAHGVDGDVILRRGKFAVDGTSFLGVISIVNTAEPVIIEYPDDAFEFNDFLAPFII